MSIAVTYGTTEVPDVTRLARLALGLIVGLGFAMSAIGMPITGAWGLQDAMHFKTAIGAATFVLAWFLPTEQKIRELRGG